MPSKHQIVSQVKNLFTFTYNPSLGRKLFEWKFNSSIICFWWHITVKFVVIFTSINGELWSFNRVNNVPREFSIERYLINNKNVFGRVDSLRERKKDDDNNQELKRIRLFLPNGSILIGRIVGSGWWVGVRRATLVKLLRFLVRRSPVEKTRSVSLAFDVSITGIQPWLINCVISIKFEITESKKFVEFGFFKELTCEIILIWTDSISLEG